MSRIRADKFVNNAATGAPQLTFGAEIPVGVGLTGAGGIDITGVATATQFSGNLVGTTATVGSATTITTGGINVTGVITATSFSGDGSNLVGAGISASKVYTYNQLFS